MSDNEKTTGYILPVSNATVSSTGTAMTLYLEEAAKQALGIRPPVIWRQAGRARDDHQIYSFVGRVASEWAHLEHTLDLIIWELAGIDQQDGACITAQMMGAIPRYRTILTQLRHKVRVNSDLDKFLSKINKLQGDTHDPQEERNRIVHDPWYVTFEWGANLTGRFGPETPAQFKSMPHKSPRFGIVDADMEKIEKTLEQIKQLASRADAIRQEISAALEAWREKRP
jgi:hypothetical protein